MSAKGLHCRFLLFRGGPSAWRAVNVSSNASAAPRALEGAPLSTPAISTAQNETPLSTRQHGLDHPVPATLNISVFRDSVEAPWLFNHYAHRPALQQIIVSSSNRNFGAAAIFAAPAIGTTLFARFHNLPLWPHTRPVQAPYCRGYASAVEALSTQIPLFKVDTLEEVMVPALLLLIAKSWLPGLSQEHYGGLEQLVRVSRDALTQQSRLDLFHEVRLTMVWYAMSRGERNIFGEEWWRSAPFVPMPSPTNPSDHLVDCMADIAALLEDAKELELVTGEPLTVELEYRARAILQQLFSWRWSWLARNPDSVFEVQANSGGPFGTVFKYAQPHLMYEIWLCDALLILVLAFLNPDIKLPSL